ncbi:unnamed protein product [Caenorhabditis bovis]|uniref:Peptidase S1 domain-containing protein n=1 Tax=Caenorhabditis bovis TaxID=2654633 RepID=A0A8S1F8R8_9PELO|nr:unnamed protein product [Caenorhabditis bovis]
MLEKEIELDLPDNTLTKSSIKAALLLPDDAILSLSYDVNGHRKFCRVNDSSTTFLLPEQFPTLHFFVESDKAPSRPNSSLSFEGHLSGYRERSESPYVFNEKLADELRNRLFFIPRGQKALQDEEETSVELKGDLVVDGGCASPISSRAVVTYAHKSHKILREYDESKNDEDNKHSLVEIRHAENPRIRHKMKVIVVDTHHDFVILRSVDGREIFEDYPYIMRPPKNFEPFIGFGLSHETKDGQQITHRHGRICSESTDYRGRFLASSSIDGGDSGGPCYAADRALIGIMVASTATDPILRREYDRDSIEEEIVEASSHPADTWITPGNLINEAYKNYQVKHGLSRVPRRERNLSEPRAKRRAMEIF